MSRNFNYNNMDEELKIKDYDGFKKWLKKMKSYGEGDELNLSFLLHVRYVANPKENRLDWLVKFGFKYDELDGIKNAIDRSAVNHMSPEDAIVQDFFMNLAKFVEPFDFVVLDEEFPVIGSFDFAWRFESTNNGKLFITKLQLVEGERVFP